MWFVNSKLVVRCSDIPIGSTGESVKHETPSVIVVPVVQ